MSQTIEQFKHHQGENFSLFLKKHGDYGPAPIALGQDMSTPQGQKLAAFGVVVRINDKVGRLLNLLTQGKAPNYESIADSLADIANYATIGQVVLSGKWGKE